MSHVHTLHPVRISLTVIVSSSPHISLVCRLPLVQPVKRLPREGLKPVGPLNTTLAALLKVTLSWASV